jgi:hypothetical protein
MPSQANITVKKNDGTTDITYTAQQPSSGDGVQAIWKSTSVGTAPVHQPELRVSARALSNGKREIRWTYVYPEIQTNSTTGATNVAFRERASASLEIDTAAATLTTNEFVAQFMNLLASAHAKAIAQGGYGPT